MKLNLLPSLLLVQLLSFCVSSSVHRAQLSHNDEDDENRHTIPDLIKYDTRKLNDFKDYDFDNGEFYDRIPRIYLHNTFSYHMSKETPGNGSQYLGSYTSNSIRFNISTLWKLIGSEQDNNDDITFGELAQRLFNLSFSEIIHNLDDDGFNIRFIDNKDTEFYTYNNEEDYRKLDKYHMGYPTSRHHNTLQKYASVTLPFYIIIALLGLLVFQFRRKFLHHRERWIKLSNVSSMILKVLILRFVFDLIYLVYLILFVVFNWLSHKLIFISLIVIDQLIELGVFHITVAVFCQGYLTLHYDTKVLYNKFAISIITLYTFCVFAIHLFVRVKSLGETYRWGGLQNIYQFGNFDLIVVICIYTILCRIALYMLLGWKFWQQYKESASSSKQKLFVKSAIIIAVLYLMSSYIRVPIYSSLSELWSGLLRNIFVGDGDMSFDTETMSVPEVVQFLTGTILIYLWRDTEYEKLAEGEEEIEMQ